MTDQTAIDVAEIQDAEEVFAPTAPEIADMLMSILSDNVDHPEVWPQIGQFLDYLPDLPTELARRLDTAWSGEARAYAAILLIMCYAARAQVDFALEQIEPLAITHSQSALVQGAVFYLKSLKDPHNPIYRLHGKICHAPFEQLDVLETSTHQCCASWLQTSAGNLQESAWEDVWNSEAAQQIRESIIDGSYRYCNKVACPRIQLDDFFTTEQLLERSPIWNDILEHQLIELPQGPEVVNLAYDRTCNLSCPSCRTEAFAADEDERQRYQDMQEHKILPMLKNAKAVFITGSGDPFASKNFRSLMTRLTPEEYPELRFQIMTNGMLFNERQWNAFPSLHNRVKLLKISIDAAEGPTHELLRRGARWPVMLENMAFAGRLAAEGHVAHYDLVFTVQAENYREMGDAVDLAKRMGANGICFCRITNWGTFTSEEYARKAVFMPSHPDHQDFVESMQDPRLRDPIVTLGDLLAFVREPTQLAA